jgi:hypothetical protein
MGYNPADYNFDYKVQEAYDELQTAGQPDPLTFGEGFTFSDVVTGDKGFGEWATSGLTGLFLSGAASDDSQNDWFVQRHSIDYGLKALEEKKAAYEQAAEAGMKFSQEEVNDYTEIGERIELLNSDLMYVANSLNGNMDAVMDEEGKSFNDRWGVDKEDDEGLGKFLELLYDNPTYIAGVLADETLKDLPISIIAYFGLAAKGASGVSVVDKVVRKISGIKPKALRGLTIAATGPAIGAGAGAGYELAYSLLEQGTPNVKHIEQGAIFGGAFGVLGSIGLAFKASKSAQSTPKLGKAAEVEVAETVVGPKLDKISKAEDVTSKAAAEMEKLLESGKKAEEEKRLNQQAEDLTILDKYIQTTQERTNKSGNAFESEFDAEKREMITYIDTKALEFERKSVVDELRQQLFSGQNKDLLNTLTPAQYRVIKSGSGFKAMMLAQEKAKTALKMEHFRQGPTDKIDELYLEDTARKIVLEELNRIDAKTAQPNKSTLDARNVEKLQNEGLPAFTIDKDLVNREGTKVLASTNKDGLIRINPVKSAKEFRSYIHGKVTSATSKQKRKVNKVLKQFGYNLDYQLKSNADRNRFLVLHEQSHIRNNDIAKYPRNEDGTIDLDSDAAIDIEVRASMEALHDMGIGPMDEAETIASKNIQANRQTKGQKAGLAQAEQETLKGQGKFGKYIDANPKKSMLGAAVAGYALSGDNENEFYGPVLAAALVGLGPKAYKLVNSQALGKSAMKVKIAISKGIEDFSANAKLLDMQMQYVIDEVQEVFEDAGRGKALIDSIEKGLTGRKLKEVLTDPEIVTQKKVISMLKIIRDQAKEVGILKNKDGNALTLEAKDFKKGERGAVLQNYFPHLFVNEIDDKVIQKLVKLWGDDDSVHGKKRTLQGTVADIDKAHPEMEIITDPAQVLSLYTQAMTRAIYGKNLTNSMMKLDISSIGKTMPAMMTTKAFQSLKKTAPKDGGISKQDALHYEYFEHPSLEGYVAHTDVKNLLDDQFAVMRRGGMSDIMEKTLKLNNGLKRVFVFGSLFHAQALVMSAAYSMGVSGAVKGIGGRGKLGAKATFKKEDGTFETREVSYKDIELGTGVFRELAEQAIKDGLQIVNIKRQELVNPGKVEIDKFLKKFGYAGELANTGFEKIDHITWEYLHDRFKLAAYLRHKEKLMSDGMLMGGMDEAKAGRAASTFANDAFGSLDWANFTTKLYEYASKHPDKFRGKLYDKTAQLLPTNKRRWLNLGLFAPDWTISNIRIIGKTFTGLPAVSQALAKRIHKGNWEGNADAEAVVKAWNMYAMYAFRAGVTTSAMYWIMSELFSDKEPSMEGLADFWYGDNSHKLDLGNGESMVISKQIAEPIHWLQHTIHTLMNKGSVVPKTIVEGMFNKQWFSMKKGFPMGPAILDKDGNYHYPKWLLGKAVPIVSKPLFADELSWTERFERVVTGFFGFPQYGKKEGGDY